MGIDASWDTSESSLCIRIVGKFNHGTHQVFKETYARREVIGMSVRVDLRETDYLDSAALGMLVLLLQHVEKHKGSVVLAQPNKSVMQVLQTARFHDLFTIEQ